MWRAILRFESMLDWLGIENRSLKTRSSLRVLLCLYTGRCTISVLKGQTKTKHQLAGLGNML